MRVVFMYKKINNYIFVMIAVGYFGVACAMELQDCKESRSKKDSITCQLLDLKRLVSCNVNNCIVPVSSQYQALKKEEALWCDILENNKKALWREIKNLNNQNRLSYRKAGMPVLSIDFNEVRDSVSLYDRRNFHTHHLEIVYLLSSHNPPTIQASMTVSSTVYTPSSSLIQLHKARKRVVGIKDIGNSLAWQLAWCCKGKMEGLLSQGKPFCIELSSEGNLSDWVKFTSFVKLTPSVQPQQQQKQVLQQDNRKVYYLAGYSIVTTIACIAMLIKLGYS